MTAKNLILSAGSGEALPAGSIGEVIEVKKTTPNYGLSTTAGTITDIGHSTFTLPPGTWEIFASCSLNIGVASGTGANGRNAQLFLTDSNNTVIGGSFCCFANNGQTNTGSGTVLTRITINASTSYKLRAATTENNGVTSNPLQFAAYGFADTPIVIRAVRIA
jgi:hypothetical protein